ncbi:hypothetical protein MES5069_720020 [Mesorhizobium escarrei]|uniref:Uncharacterized protein n=1 Tax=Mesorhizobium escarrei TaxID=666018 RepID=A0ABM9EHJ6_9HYPH|nr:hypothetical protein MES5069_720020 [Mesorhizobium escarrei]
MRPTRGNGIAGYRSRANVAAPGLICRLAVPTMERALHLKLVKVSNVRRVREALDSDHVDPSRPSNNLS